MSYVKINAREWARELYDYVAAEFSADELAGCTGDPRALMIEHFVEWAARAYAHNDAPRACDLAAIYFNDSVFIDRAARGVSEDDWPALCNEEQVLFHNDNYACVTDGYTTYADIANNLQTKK